MRSGTWCSDLAAELAQQRDHQRRAARAIHVVVAEHADGLAMLHRVGEAIRGDVHVDQHGRVGQQRAQGGIEEVARRIDVDAARGEQATDDLRHAHTLGDAETDAVLAVAPYPTPAAQAATDAENAVAHDETADERGSQTEVP